LRGAEGLRAEDEILSAGQLPQGEILGWGADENQIAGLGVVPGQQPSPLDVNLMFQARKHLVEIVDGHYLSHARVVIPNLLAGVQRRIEIAETRLRPADELGVAVNHQGRIRTAGKSAPKGLYRWRGLLVPGGWRLSHEAARTTAAARATTAPIGDRY
jgi:hypothetical protein